MEGEKNSWVAVLDKVIVISRQFITLKLYTSKMSRNGSRINEEDEVSVGQREITGREHLKFHRVTGIVQHSYLDLLIINIINTEIHLLCISLHI